MGRQSRKLAAALALQFVFALSGWTQSYPAKPVRIISPYPPGGGNDILARTLSPKLGEYLGQQVIVDNRPGANTIIGTELAARSPAAPEIPTVAESGVPGYSTGLWYGFLAPARTPREIVQRLNSEIAKVLKLPDVRERLLGLGVDPQSSTPEEFTRLIAADLEKWAKVVRASGARID